MAFLGKKLPFFGVQAALVGAAAAGVLASLAVWLLLRQDTKPETSQPAVGPIAKLAFSVHNGDASDIYVSNPDGSGRRNLTHSQAKEAGPVWSPDGKRFAFTSSRLGNLNIFVINLDGSGLTTITNDNRVNASPRWSPDGRKLLFTNGSGIHVINADGTDAKRLIAHPGGASWSPDGKHILYETTEEIHGTSPGQTTYKTEIGIMNADGSGARSIPISVPEVGIGDFSPDGTKISLITNGLIDAVALLVMDADGSGLRRLTSGAFVFRAEWSPDGKALIYLRSIPLRKFVMEQQICIVRVDGSGESCLPNKYIDNDDGDQSPVWRFN